MTYTKHVVYDGGITAVEMTSFLWHVDKLQIRNVMESGRGQHAYSTRVLWRWLKAKPGREAWSVDYEYHWKARLISRWRLRHCRASNFHLLTGDSYFVLPELLSKMSQPVALLIDGPKSLPAMGLIYCLTREHANVRIVALHNCREGSKDGRLFHDLFPSAEFVGQLAIARTNA